MIVFFLLLSALGFSPLRHLTRRPISSNRPWTPCPSGTGEVGCPPSFNHPPVSSPLAPLLSGLDRRSCRTLALHPNLVSTPRARWCRSLSWRLHVRQPQTGPMGRCWCSNTSDKAPASAANSSRLTSSASYPRGYNLGRGRFQCCDHRTAAHHSGASSRAGSSWLCTSITTFYRSSLLYAKIDITRSIISLTGVTIGSFDKT